MGNGIGVPDLQGAQWFPLKSTITQVADRSEVHPPSVCSSGFGGGCETLGKWSGVKGQPGEQPPHPRPPGGSRPENSRLSRNHGNNTSSRTAAPYQARAHGAKPLPAGTLPRVRKEKQGSARTLWLHFTKGSRMTKRKLCFCVSLSSLESGGQRAQGHANSVPPWTDGFSCLKEVTPGIPAGLTFGQGGSYVRVQQSCLFWSPA